MNKDKIINYLYNEMTDLERRSFEKVLFENQELRKEVKEIQITLGLVQDSSTFLPSRKESVGREAEKHDRFRLNKWWMAAASVLLISMVGYLSGVRCEFDQDQLVIGFERNNHIDEKTNEKSFISRNEFFAAIEDLKEQLVPDTTIVESGIQKNEAATMIANAVGQVNKNYQKWSEQTIEAYQENVRKQTEEIINEFLEYYEITRTEDLNNINTGLTNLSLLVQEFSGGVPGYAYQPTQK
jgi:hypothetical protein